MSRITAKQHRTTKLESDATAAAQSLKKIFITQNKAADACGISRARFSHIVNAHYGDVAVTQTDLDVMRVIEKYRTSRADLGEPLRELMDQFEVELVEANRANRQLATTARRISRMIERL